MHSRTQSLGWCGHALGGIGGIGGIGGGGEAARGCGETAHGRS